jgi:hypothetical protein
MTEVRLINLPKFEDPRGNLSFIEEFQHIPFKIERAYWIYDVPDIYTGIKELFNWYLNYYKRNK